MPVQESERAEFVPDAIAEEVYRILTQIEGIAVVIVVSRNPGCRDIHVVHASATKEHAIAELLKLLRVDRNDTIGIGDGYNDIHLFNAVNSKVAMGNAVPELNKSADKNIGLVSEDGLAQYLATWDL